MKKFKLTLLSMGLFVGSIAFAQSEKQISTKNAQPIEMLNNHFGEGLNLSAAQNSQIEQIRKSFGEERQKRLNNENLNRNQVAQDAEILHRMENEKLWQVLTPEQVAKYKTMKVVPDAAESKMFPQKEYNVWEHSAPNIQEFKGQPIEMLNNHFGKGLNLSVLQTNQIAEIQKTFGEERQKVLKNQNIDKASAAQQVEVLHHLENQKLWEVLTAEQAKKYKTMKVIPDAAESKLIKNPDFQILPVEPKSVSVSSHKVSEGQPIEMLNSHFGEGLDLTPAQKVKINEIRQRFEDRRQRLLNNENSSKPNSSKDIEDLHQLENEKLWKVLTKEQTKKYKNMKVVPDAVDVKR